MKLKGSTIMAKNKILSIAVITVLTGLTLAALPGLATVWRPALASELTTKPDSVDSNRVETQSTQTHTIPAAAFIQASDTNPATDDANNWLLDFNSANHFLTSDSAADQVCLVAPLYLPVGSTIESFTAYVEDNFATSNTTVLLDRTTFLGEWVELGRVTSSDGGGIRALTDNTISTVDGANVVAANFNYQVSFCLPANSGANLNVYGVQVSYSLAGTTPNTIYLPIITKSETPSTALLITNQTGGSLNYTVFNTPQGNVTCSIPNGASNQICGAFTSGVYNYKAIAICGQKVGQRSYKAGNDALTPFRCQ
jgi:hypothetical protein